MKTSIFISAQKCEHFVVSCIFTSASVAYIRSIKIHTLYVLLDLFQKYFSVD